MALPQAIIAASWREIYFRISINSWILAVEVVHNKEDCFGTSTMRRTAIYDSNSKESLNCIAISNCCATTVSILGSISRIRSCLSLKSVISVSRHSNCWSARSTRSSTTIPKCSRTIKTRCLSCSQWRISSRSRFSKKSARLSSPSTNPISLLLFHWYARQTRFCWRKSN